MQRAPAAALHVALRIAGACRGGVVPVADFTFIASANAIHYCGAQPLLVDSEPATWNMDTERVHGEITRRARAGRALPAAIEVVHVLGHPAAMEPLLDLRARYGIRIVEDAAEALGGSWGGGSDLVGRQVGTAGDLGCFSFNGNNVMTTGGGGMITTDDAGLAARARHLVSRRNRRAAATCTTTSATTTGCRTSRCPVGLTATEQDRVIVALRTALGPTHRPAMAATGTQDRRWTQPARRR